MRQTLETIAAGKTRRRQTGAGPASRSIRQKRHAFAHEPEERVVKVLARIEACASDRAGWPPSAAERRLTGAPFLESSDFSIRNRSRYGARRTRRERRWRDTRRTGVQARREERGCRFGGGKALALGRVDTGRYRTRIAQAQTIGCSRSDRLIRTDRAARAILPAPPRPASGPQPTGSRRVHPARESAGPRRSAERFVRDAGRSWSRNGRLFPLADALRPRCQTIPHGRRARSQRRKRRARRTDGATAARGSNSDRSRGQRAAAEALTLREADG